MFQFKEITAKLSKANVRCELHGEDTKLAADLSIELRGPNTILEDIAPGLLAVLYRKAEEGEDDQGELDLDPQRLSKLAFPFLQQPLKPKSRTCGWVFCLHQDGQWVTLRKATGDEMKAAVNYSESGRL